MMRSAIYLFMKTILNALLVVPALLASSSAFAAANCVDGRLVRMACHMDGRVLTSYGCKQEYGVRCAKPEEIPVIEAVTTGGFRRVPQKIELTVFRNGEIVQTTTTGSYDGSTPETVTTRNVAQLDLSIIAQMTSAAGLLRAGELTYNEDQPRCMDAPVTKWTAYSVDQYSVSPVLYFKQRDCIEERLNSDGAYTLINISKAIDQLANYLR